MSTAITSASEMINPMPENATLDDIMYKLYARQKIEVGILVVEENRITPHKEIKARLLKLRRLVS